MRIKRRKKKRINNMLSFNIWVLIFLAATSCSKPSKNEHEEKSSVEIKVDSLFDCSSVKGNLSKKNEYSTSNIDVSTLKKVESIFIEKFLPEFIGSDIYFYSSADVSDCSVVFYKQLEVDAVTKSLLLISFDQSGKIKGDIMLLAEYNPYPDGEMYIESSIVGNKLQLRKVKKSIGDYDKNTDRYSEVIDSINISSEISKQFKLKQISKDSVRMIH